MNDLKKIKIAISSLPQNGWWNNGIVAYHDNDMMSNGAIPNQDLLKKEHDNLTAILQKYSLDVIIIPFGKEIEINKKYDFVFMRDHFLCNTNKDIVMCNMKLSERMNEGKYVISTLNDLQYNVSFLDENCIAEGGEFFFLPKENILLAGQGRNNLSGAEQMAEKLKVSSLHIINSSGYHLDTSISPIFNDEYDCIGLICAREVFSDKEINDLRSICRLNQWELIEIEHQDFALSNNIIFDYANVSQFNLSGGSVHCLTNELF